MAENVEYHLLVKDRVQIVSHDLSPVCLLTQRSDDERIHIETGLCKVRFRRKIGDLDDLEENDADNVTAVSIGELIGVVTLLALQALDSEPPFALLDTLGLGWVFLFGCFVIVNVILSVVVVANILCWPSADGWGRRGARLSGSQDRCAGRRWVLGRRVSLRNRAGKSRELGSDFGVGSIWVRGIIESKLQQNLAGDFGGLLARPLALQGKPFWFLLVVAVGEYLLKSEIKLAQIVLPKPVLVPADDIEEQVSCLVHVELALFVPVRVKRLGHRVGLVPVFTEGQDKVLRAKISQSASSSLWSREKRIGLTGSEVPLRSAAARFRA